MQRILVIEDDDSVRDNLVELLEAEGFDVHSAENGTVGVQLAWESHPDLIVCDILMPGLDGYGVRATLSRDQGSLSTPFIFLTAKTERADWRRGMELGADDYITKPFTRDELLQAIRTRLEKHQAVANLMYSKLERLRSSVTGSFPNELLQPLSLILSQSEILLQTSISLSPGQARPAVLEIQAAAQHLLRSIQNYLLFIELEQILGEEGKRQAAQEDRVLEAGEVVREVGKQKARLENRLLEISIQDGQEKAHISEAFLQVIIEELLDNAFKFSPQGSQVILRMLNDITQAKLILEVEDAGRGMTREMADTLSSARVHPEDGEHHGQGLGLVLVEHIVRLYAGVLEIQSAPSKGTLVRVILGAG